MVGTQGFCWRNRPPPTRVAYCRVGGGGLERPWDDHSCPGHRGPCPPAVSRRPGVGCMGHAFALPCPGATPHVPRGSAAQGEPPCLKGRSATIPREGGWGEGGREGIRQAPLGGIQPQAVRPSSRGFPGGGGGISGWAAHPPPPTPPRPPPGMRHRGSCGRPPRTRPGSPAQPAAKGPGGCRPPPPPTPLGAEAQQERAGAGQERGEGGEGSPRSARGGGGGGGPPARPLRRAGARRGPSAAWGPVGAAPPPHQASALRPRRAPQRSGYCRQASLAAAAPRRSAPRSRRAILRHHTPPARPPGALN